MLTLHLWLIMLVVLEEVDLSIQLEEQEIHQVHHQVKGIMEHQGMVLLVVEVEEEQVLPLYLVWVVPERNGQVVLEFIMLVEVVEVDGVVLQMPEELGEEVLDLVVIMLRFLRHQEHQIQEDDEEPLVELGEPLHLETAVLE